MGRFWEGGRLARLKGNPLAGTLNCGFLVSRLATVLIQIDRRGPGLVMEKFKVRRATVAEVETIVRFNLAMAMETEEKTLNPERVRAGVHGLLEKHELGFYLVATHEGKVAGSLMVTYEWSDWRCGVFWWVQSVYVEPDYRRQGVYRCLCTYLKELATKEGGVCGFRLYVEEENFKAQKTYESLGMNACAYRMYEEEIAGYAPIE